MKKIIDYLFYRYYLISIKKEESPRFGATCVLAEVVTMVYLFAVLILSFLLTGDFFLPYTSGRTRIIIGIIGCFLPWPVIYLHYNKKRINALVEKYQKQQIQYQIFRQGGVKPPLYSTNSRTYSDADPLSVQINYNISYIKS